MDTVRQREFSIACNTFKIEENNNTVIKTESNETNKDKLKKLKYILIPKLKLYIYGNDQFYPLKEKKYLVTISVKVLDGRIFLSGKANDPEEKLKITKLAWETKGARSVKNNISIKQKFSMKNTAIDVLITSQLRAALILNKKVKAANFNIDTINQKTYIFGIAHTKDEKKEIIQEAKQIVDLKELVTSILLISDLSRQKE